MAFVLGENVKPQRFIQFILLFLFPALGLFAFELHFDMSPLAVIPRGEYSKKHWSPSVGTNLSAAVSLGRFVSLGGEFGYYVAPLNNTTNYTGFITTGLRASAFYYPTSRLKIQGSASGGVYQFNNRLVAYSNFWLKAYVEAGYRYSPSLMFSGGVGFIDLYLESELYYQGFIAGLSIHYLLDTRKSQGNLQVDFQQPEPVFPLTAGLYRDNPIGTIQIENQESAEITDVSIKFRAGNYTSAEILCGTTDLLYKFQSLELPLYADFSPLIQNFTETGKIPGELLIQYQLLGSVRNTSQSLVIDTHNRNNFRWNDPAMLASYVSPNSPEVLDFSKYMVGIARNQLRSGLNRNMQFAMYLLEGLKVGGIIYSADETTAYTETHLDPSALDYIQYPYQTLAYHSGDYDDLGLLLAGSLESVGIETALIPLEDDFIVAFSLDMTYQQMESLFYDTNLVLYIGDQFWLPLSLASLREGFINSWYSAVDSLTFAIDRGDPVDFITLKDAWQQYPPTGVSGTEAQFQKPLEERVIRTVETDLMRYITAEFGPRISALQDELRQTGGSRSLYNQLGLLYVRAGMYDEAKSELQKAAALGSSTALVNLGNIAMLQRDYEQAKQMYQQALELNPDSQGAISGLNRALAELLQ